MLNEDGLTIVRARYDDDDDDELAEDELAIISDNAAADRDEEPPVVVDDDDTMPFRCFTLLPVLPAPPRLLDSLTVDDMGAAVVFVVVVVERVVSVLVTL